MEIRDLKYPMHKSCVVEQGFAGFMGKVLEDTPM